MFKTLYQCNYCILLTYLIFFWTRVGRHDQFAINLSIQVGRRVFTFGTDLGDERGFGHNHCIGGGVRFYGILTTGGNTRHRRVQRQCDENTLDRFHF